MTDRILTRPRSVSTTPFEQHDVEVAGVRLRYIDIAAEPSDVPSDTSARHPLVVLGGHTSRIEGFDHLVQHLPTDRRRVVLDFPGSGYSDKPSMRYDLPFYEDTLMDFLDTLGIDSAVPVGGSLGGNLVLRLGYRYPERFPHLVLWAPGGAWKARPRLARFIRRVGSRRLFWASVRVQSRFWYHPDFPGRAAALTETFAYYREVECPGFIDMYWGMAADQLAHSLFDIAPQINQATLLMWGDQDNGAGMAEGVQRLRALLPNCSFHVFADVRHSIETEIPAELGTCIATFLSQQDVSAARDDETPHGRNG